MSVVPCLHYSVSFDRADTDVVLRTLSTWGKFEPIDPKLPMVTVSHEEMSQKITLLKSRYAGGIAYARELRGEQSLAMSDESMEDAMKSVFDSYDATVRELDHLMGLVTKAEKAQAVRTSFEDRTREIRTLLDRIKAITQPIFATHTLFHTKLLAMPLQAVPAFERFVDGDSRFVAEHISQGADEAVYLLSYAANTPQTDVDEIFHRHDAQEITIDPSLHGHSPKALFGEIDKKLNALLSREHAARDELLAHFAQHEQAFLCVVQLLEYEQQSVSLYQYVGYYTGSLTRADATKISLLREGSRYELYGWIAPEDESEFVSLFSEQSSGVVLEKESPENVEEARTILKNHPLVRPFEMITKLMGVPSSREIDPTPYFSPFFILFFGFALGDGGYGLIMLAIALYGLFKLKLDEGMRGAMILLLLCSISTVFFGAITGSWFGANLDVVPGSFGALLRSIKLFDMQRSIILVLGGSIAIGFIHQIVGLFLEMAVYIKNRDYKTALASPGTWILLLLAITARIAAPALGASEQMITILQYVLYGSFGAFLIGQGINARPIFLIPLIGLAQLFNITGFVSNSLSYARLLALGLATGVIAGVINFLANLFGGTDSILGMITLVFVLLLGHTVNIGLNVLGTFINVLRLQLVEFFPRFFNAQGVELSPRGLWSEYLRLTQGVSRLYVRNFPIIITNYKKKNL